MFTWLKRMFKKKNILDRGLPEPIGYPPIPILRGNPRVSSSQIGSTFDEVPIVVPSFIQDDYVPVGAVNVPARPTPVAIPEQFPDTIAVASPPEKLS